VGIQIQPCCCDTTCVAGTYNPIDTFILDCGFSFRDLVADLTLLDQCDIIFVGPYNAGAGATYTYPAPLQAAVKTWVEAGGRMFFTANPTATFDAGGTGNVAAYNAFLGFLGTGMQLTANIPFGCPPVADCVDVIPVSIGVMNGLAAPLKYALSGEISGGTVLAGTSIDFPILGCDIPWNMIAAEQIGDGLVVACGSSNIMGACGDPCEFFQRLCKWSIARILGP